MTHYLHIHFLGLPKQIVPVEYASDASEIFAAVRDANGFGASAMRGKCGLITDADGKKVGRISYNGRIWDANDKPLTPSALELI